MNCSRCRRVLRRDNRSGICARCHRGPNARRMCRICGVVPQSARGWCGACLRDVAPVMARAHALPAVRPDPGLLAERLAVYAERAEAGEPLFRAAGRGRRGRFPGVLLAAGG